MADRLDLGPDDELDLDDAEDDGPWTTIAVERNGVWFDVGTSSAFPTSIPPE